MGQQDPLHISQMRQIDGDEAGGMAPVFLMQHKVSQRVLRVKDQNVSVRRPAYIRVILVNILRLMLGVGSKHDRRPVKVEAIAITAAGMVQKMRRDGEPFKLKRLVRFDIEEGQISPQHLSRHRKIRRLELVQQRRLQRLSTVPAADPDLVAGDEGGNEKRETLNVVPVHVGHQNRIAALRHRPFSAHGGAAEYGGARSEINYHSAAIGIFKLDAGRLAAMAYRQSCAGLNISARRRLRAHIARPGGRQCGHQRFVKLRLRKGHGQGTARAPELHTDLDNRIPPSLHREVCANSDTAGKVLRHT